MQPDTITALAPLNLILGPAGSGKTDAALRRICADLHNSLLIVTSTAQAEWLAQRAAELASVPLSDALDRVLPFSGLVAEVLRRDSGARRMSIGRSFQRMILTALVPAAIRDDDFLGKMLSAPGFVSALQDRLREWKLAGAEPSNFGSAAASAAERGMPELGRKLRDIERLFGAYEQFLNDNKLQDEESGLSRAVHLIRDGDAPIPRDARVIVVHGFYRFTGAQRQLLRALAERGTESGSRGVDLVVTLPFEERRPLLFAAPGRTLAQLRREFTTREVVLPPVDHQRNDPPDALTRLSAGLFGVDPNSSDDMTDARDAGRSIKILEAPNSYVEAELVAREFRRLHESLKIPWSEFAVVLRSTGDYAPILSAVFERYAVPIGAEGPENCARNPLLKTVLLFLDVVRYDWRREDVLAFLKSSYTAPESLHADSLRRYAWANAIRDGRDEWLAIVGLGSRSLSGVSSGHSQSIDTILREMARIDGLLRRTSADTRHFVGVVRDIVATFGLEDRIVQGEPTRVDRDTAALKEALNMLEALNRMALLRSVGTVSFAEFHETLRDAWENASAFPETGREQVCVMEPYASGERSIRVGAVMGLTERVFPRRITEDPFVRDEERRLLRDWTGIELEEQRLRADDERFLFYMAITAPAERLLLSFPRAAHENDTLPSFFLDEVRTVFENPSKPDTSDVESDEPREPGRANSPNSGIDVVIRTLADVAPRADETVTPADELLAACADLFDPQGGSDTRRNCALAAARRIRGRMDDADGDTARAVLRSRSLPRLPALRDTALRNRFSSCKKVYTVSELETYARCPFRYLLRDVWKLKPEIDGLDPAKQSALLHTVLRRYFRARLKRDEPGREADAVEQVFAELQRILDESLTEARFNATGPQVRILRRRLNDDLMGFAIREVRYTAQFATMPAHFHVCYGRAPIAVTPDPLSCPEPLILTAPDGGSVAITGIIDRVDLDASGRRALVVEYEVGRPPEFAAILRGESLQMPMNLLAIERLFGLAAAGACYDSMQEAGRRRFHRTEHVNIRAFAPVMPFDDPANVKPLSRAQFDELVKTAQDSAIRLADSIVEGSIAATPGMHCRGCDFRDACRTSLVDGHDGERPVGP